MKHRFFALTFALSAISASTAFAQSNLYGFAYGGINLNGELNQSGTIGGAPQSVDSDFDNGTSLGFGVGTYLPGWNLGSTSFRGEAEFSFSKSDADQIRFSGNGPASEVNVSGDVKTQALFANLYADFATGTAFTPYVGAGLGYGRVEQNLVYGPGVSVPDSSNGVAAQIIVGGAYALNDNWALTADARFRRFFDAESRRLNPAGGLTGNIEGDYDDFSVNVGVRFGF
jgi:opacity protein-like surface antigen